MAMPAEPPAGDYPVTFNVAYPQRLTNLLVLVKWLLVIPHFIVLWFLGFLLIPVVIIAFFAVLFTGRVPKSLFDFIVGYYRWQARASAYILLTDKYPPFRLAP